MSERKLTLARVRHHMARASGCAVTVRAGATTETEAAELRIVTGCRDCPAYEGVEDWCDLARREVLSAPLARRAPDWCPLRQGPVVLRLEEADERSRLREPETGACLVGL